MCDRRPHSTNQPRCCSELDESVPSSGGQPDPRHENPRSGQHRMEPPGAFVASLPRAYTPSLPTPTRIPAHPSSTFVLEWSAIAFLQQEIRAPPGSLHALQCEVLDY